jgi:hypothetical protein
MIFDSPSMAKLREKYRQSPDYRVPMAVLRDRSEMLGEERIYLEHLISLAPEARRNDWIGRLTSEEDEQHYGAWFEIMLFGWLTLAGLTEAEPNIAENHPDFRFISSGTPIYIEARAILIPAEERSKRRGVTELLAILHTIEKPFMLTILTCKIRGELDQAALCAKVSNWLDNDPDKVLIYEDSKGNMIGIQAKKAKGLGQLDILGPSDAKYANPDSLKRALSEKAQQHKQLRRAGHAYIVAVWLENWLYTPNEVVQAWLGKLVVDVDINTKQVVGQRVDRSGLHFGGPDIRHTSVSGTLVFRSPYNASILRHELQAWYIQNPFALTPIAADAFPVQASLVVASQDSHGYSMSWRPTIPDWAI